MLSISVIILVTCLSNFGGALRTGLLQLNNKIDVNLKELGMQKDEDVNAHEFLELGMQKQLDINASAFFAGKHDEYGNGSIALETNSTSGLGFCGIPQHMIDGYLNPPREVQEVISWSFGVNFGIGTVPDDDSCGALHKYTKNIQMAYISVNGPGQVNKLITSKAGSDQKKRERCHSKCHGMWHCKRNCPNVGLVEKVSNAQEYVNPYLPVCMAISPCKGTFGIHVKNGVPIFQLGPIQFSLITVVFSTSGGLTVPAFDPPLLKSSMSNPHPLGAHIFVEGSMSFPIKIKGGKEIIVVEMNPISIGAYGQLTDSNWRTISSPFQLMSKLFGSGLNVNEVAKQIRSIKSATLQLYGSVKATITLKIGAIIGKSGVGDLTLDSSASFMLDFRASSYGWGSQKKIAVSTWASLNVKANLKDLFSGCGKLQEVIPGVQVEMDAKLFLKVSASSRWHADRQLQVFVKASVTLDCGVIQRAVNDFTTLINTVNGHVDLGPIHRIVNHLNHLINNMCGKTISAEFSLAASNNGFDRDATYIGFNGMKLKLSDLPTCPSNAKIGEPCSSNSDCQGGLYCLNHPTYKSSIACQGTCIAKRGSGGDCSVGGAHLPPWLHLDFGNAENNICASHSCLCGTCGPVANGHRCATNHNCASGWCEGRHTVDCKGTCQARKPEGHHPWGGDGNSCVHQGRVICGLCASAHGRVHGGRRCSTNANCHSGNCQGRGWFGTSINCQGVCR